jgi:hypothetical protein
MYLYISYRKWFKRTNSQQTCNIDVNKASKLWEAFDKVGWFEERHFSGVLRRHQGGTSFSRRE